jgi:hypothetical protein
MYKDLNIKIRYIKYYNCSDNIFIFKSMRRVLTFLGFASLAINVIVKYIIGLYYNFPTK